VRIILEERAAGPFAFWAKRGSQDRRLGHAAVKSSAAAPHNITPQTEHLPMNRRGFLTVHSTR
jgi:hypothetical protein